MVPEGWNFNQLEMSATVIDCKHRTPPYVDDGIPVVSPGSIQWGEIDLKTPTKRVTQGEYKTLMDHCTVEIGDLVLSRNQSIGVASYVTNNNPFVLGQDTVLLKPNNCNSRFLFYCLQSENTQRSIFKLSGGSTFSRINLKDIRNLKILTPPLLEQKKIARILSTWDRAIKTVEKLIENSKAQKKALMQQLLTGKRRLPGFDGECREVRLKKICTIKKGAQLNRDTLDKSGKYPVINGGVEPSGYTRNYNTDKDTITISEGGNSCGFVSFMEKEFWCGGHCYALNSVKINNLYLYHFLKFIERNIMRLRVGSGLPNIQKKAVEAIAISIPGSSEQQKIATILTTADKEIATLQQRLDCLKQEKKSLMQQLLTGKRRVKVT